MLAPSRPVCQRDFLTPAGRNPEHLGVRDNDDRAPLPGLRRYALSILTFGAAVLLTWPLHPLQDIAMPRPEARRGEAAGTDGAVTKADASARGRQGGDEARGPHEGLSHELRNPLG